MKLQKETENRQGVRNRWYDDACGTAFALDLIGERWSILIIRELLFGPRRFSELRAGLPGISAKILTQRLEGLEASRILKKRKAPPPLSAQVYELTGPRLMTFPQAVKEIAEATGRDIKFQPLRLEENREILKSAQLPEGYIWLVNYLFEDVLDGRNASVSDDIERALGRKAKDFKEYVKDTAATGVWNRV